MKEKLIKNNYYKIVLGVLYLALFLPYVYSIFYSMPATDDYAWAIEWFSTNRLVEVVKRVQWNYMNWFGQSGVFAVVIQILFNPLYWFKDVGHSFGICMVLVYTLIVIGLICAIKGLAKSLLKIEDEFIRSVFTFLLITLLFTTYYYNDVYNWWSGTPGYSMMMVVMLFCMKFISDYVNDQDKKSYIKMIITGAIACTGLMNCVAIGLFYILEVFFNEGFKERVKKDVMPLLIYVISGVITVIAPGNYKRTDSYDKGDIEIVKGLYVTIYDILERSVQTLKLYPWVTGLAFSIIVLGLCSKSENKPRIIRVIIGAILVIMSSIGALYPYIVGERKSIGDGLAERAKFEVDFIILIGFAIVLFAFGQWLSYKIGFKISIQVGLTVGIAIISLSLILAKFTGTLMYIVPVDIICQRAEIKEIYYTWEDITKEIQDSQETDVVIRKENVPWTRFSYPAGIDPGEYSRINTDENYYGNTNQCAAKWYEKNSVSVYIN